MPPKRHIARFLRRCLAPPQPEPAHPPQSSPAPHPAPPPNIVHPPAPPAPPSPVVQPSPPVVVPSAPGSAATPSASTSSNSLLSPPSSPLGTSPTYSPAPSTPTPGPSLTTPPASDSSPRRSESSTPPLSSPPVSARSARSDDCEYVPRMDDTLPRLDIANPPQERLRLQDASTPWRRFGPYLSDRQWGTVREDYSPDGEAWSWFSHDDARARAYCSGEDGLLGYCDERQLLNFALSVWNGRDPILKSRLWGLTNDEGVHGEDVKEVYYFEDATPTSSYLRAMYRYPCDEFPYEWIVKENRRLRHELYETKKYVKEFELLDTGVFDNDRFFDVSVEYFKNDPLDTFICITVENCAHTAETIHVLPTLFFRNTWSWSGDAQKPLMRVATDLCEDRVAALSCDAVGDDVPPMTLFCEGVEKSSLLFCDNETDFARFEGRSICRSLYKKSNTSNYPKNGIDDYVVAGDCSRVNPAQEGSKGAAHFVFELPPGSTKTIRLRLLPTAEAYQMKRNPFSNFDDTLSMRKREADAFYAWVSPNEMSDDRRAIQRQAFAGMLWSKMTYIYNVSKWLAEGPQSRRAEGARNRDWLHFNAEDVISSCDGWEYPWFAAWDAAFHNVVFAMIDPEFAKRQVLLLLGQNFVSSNGQIPAYEWDLQDCNPPLHAWSAYKVFCIERDLYGAEDRSFLRHCYPRLNRFYTWYVTSTEIDGQRTAGRSFLGLDNIAIVDRSKLPSTVEALYQADGTAWAAAVALTMMKISLELREESSASFASQFFVDASFRAMALNNYEGDYERPGYSRPHLYSERDGFYYDVIKLKHDQKPRQLSAPTLVGVLPIVAIETVDNDVFKKRPAFSSSVRDYFGHKHHARLGSRITSDGAMRRSDEDTSSHGGSSTMGVFSVDKDKLRRILKKLLDPNEFLSDFGIRSASCALAKSPFRFDYGEGEKELRYLPAESYGDGKMFGGNSSWRGSIWMPTTYLIIESLIKYHTVLGDEYMVEYPTGSGSQMNLRQVAFDIARRVSLLFEKNTDGHRPCLQSYWRYQGNPRWERPLFFEYFDGDNGSGIGANHQTGWTGLIADLIPRIANEEGRI